jgi:hypothetical protein
MKNTCFLFFSLFSLCLCGCFKEENPVARKDRGSVVDGVAEVGSDYSNEVYFSLLTKKNVRTIGKFTWDIALSGNATNPFIMLNTSKSMFAYKTGKSSLLEVKDTIGKTQEQLIDYPCGHADSLALSGILSNQLVYIIDLGYDISSQKTGFVLLKAKMLNNAYFIEYSNVNGSNYQSKTIPFDSERSLLFYNFQTAEVLPEPISQEWDLLMTQYQHVYYDPFQTYAVVGCLINQSTLLACEYKGEKDFLDVQAEDTSGCVFSNRRNIIGFGWKYYNLSSNQYIINPKKTYFVKRKASGMIYKLHFIDFYSSSGLKGTATFEFQEI